MASKKQVLDRLYSFVDAAWLPVLLALLVAVLLDLTILHGRIPNFFLWGTWTAFFVWLVSTSERRERERAERVRGEAPTRGLIVESDAALTLPLPPVSLSLISREARDRATNLMRHSFHGGAGYVFETAVMEDPHWADGDPSRHDLAVCLVEMPGILPQFHIEVGRGLRRLRGPWPKPVVTLSATGTRIVADPLPSDLVASLCQPRMIEFLAGLGFPCHIRVEGTWMVLFGLRPDEGPWRIMQAAEGFCDRIPRHVFRPGNAPV